MYGTGKKNKQIIDVHALLEDILREARRLRVWALVLILVCALGLCAYRYITYSPAIRRPLPLR